MFLIGVWVVRVVYVFNWSLGGQVVYVFIGAWVVKWFMFLIGAWVVRVV